MLITGLHTVVDIYCVKCQSVLGWKYEEAYEESQKCVARADGQGHVCAQTRASVVCGRGGAG